MDLTTMRGNLRKDLHDEDFGNYRWTDTVLNRHIERAVKEYGAAGPLAATVILPGGRTRRYDLTGQPGYLFCERVEYPVDEYPPACLDFWEDGVGSVVLLSPSMPETNADVKFWYAKAHTLDASGSTIPKEHEELVALGAAGFAAVEWANYAIGRLNVTGQAPEWYRAWGEARLKEFWTRLDGLRATRAASGAAVVPHWGGAPRRWARV